jgi:hypothetical protein
MGSRGLQEPGATLRFIPLLCTAWSVLRFTLEWAGEQPHARVHWEVYGPEDLVSPAVFPEYGSERVLRLAPDARVNLEHPIPDAVRPPPDGDQPAGRRSTTIRAALADVFGRPAVTHQTVEWE